MKIGFIGTGNMGGALASAAAKSAQAELLLANRTPEKAQALAAAIGARVCDNAAAAGEADHLFLGVKPQMLDGVAQSLSAPIAASEGVFVSMVAGVQLERLERTLGADKKIIRILPNTPCAVGQGVVLYCANARVTDDDLAAFCALMADAGIVDPVPEQLIDAGCAITGCGPAFAYMFIEALAAGRGSAARDRYIFREGRGEHGELPPNDWQSFFGGPAWAREPDGQWYLHLFDKAQPDVNWKNPDIHEEFKKTQRFWSDHGTDGFRIDVAHGLAKDLESKPLEELGREYSVVGVLNHDFSHPLFDRREEHDIYREWRQVFNEYTPPRFAVGEAWVKAESQHLYASTDELGQVFNFEFAEANWFADEFRTAIADGLRAAEETHGSTTTWVMNNHDVPRSPSRFGLPQVKDAPYHQLAHDWLLRDGETYRENRERGTRRARAAALMELGLPGSAYV